MENKSTKRRLYRSNDRILGGVLAGFAEYINYDPSIIRIIYVIISVFSVGFPGLLLYIIFWAITPSKPVM